ncbi:hypothetical protein pb186bvf_019630 [Paramecium bursaria]
MQLTQCLREKYHVTIRKKQKEEFFKQKRNNYCYEMDQQPEFPHEYFQNVAKNQLVQQSLERINMFFVHEHSEQAIKLSMDDIFNWLPFLVQQIDQYPQEVSKCLVNLTFQLNNKEMKQFLSIVHFSSLLSLLKFANLSDVSESFSQILINFVNDLSVQEFKLLNDQYNLVEVILQTIENYGCTILGQTNFTKIIAHLVELKAQINHEQIAIYADKILLDQYDNPLRCAGLKLLCNVLEQIIDPEEIMTLVPNIKCLGHIINQLGDENVSSNEIVYTTKLIWLLCRINNFLLNYVINQFNLFSNLQKLLASQLYLTEPKIQNKINEILIEIFDFNNDEEDEVHDELLRSFIQATTRLLRECLDLRKKVKTPPNSIIRLFIVLISTNYWGLFLANCPLIEVINLMMSQDELPCDYKTYLQLMSQIVEQGEQIYPEIFVGKFLKYNGEAIIEEIQMKGDDDEFNMLQDFLKDIYD